MINLREWLAKLPEHCLVPLFHMEDDITVATQITANHRRLLLRHPLMEEAIITVVEQGLNDSEWEGLLFIMGKGELPAFTPIYIGKTERRGVKHPISENIKNLRKSKHKFARWGDGLDYHMGDLSHAMFEFEAYRLPTKKYKRWAQELFRSYDPPILKETINFYVVPWYKNSKGPSGLVCSLPAAEKEVIALASVAFAETLLNVDGV